MFLAGYVFSVVFMEEFTELLKDTTFQKRFERSLVHNIVNLQAYTVCLRFSLHVGLSQKPL